MALRSPDMERKPLRANSLESMSYGNVQHSTVDNAGYKAKRSPTLKKMAVVKQGAETAADAPRYAIACTSPSGYDNQPTVLLLVKLGYREYP
ncbi:hypothetical protein DL546_007359 [Coniochaeta pulveracea]|uniref:Uncharacterized protein n=1 Tax=Coniochaeta pulveracea TaxID=177199 RepID=A0A420YCS7_9PEZI|nr:hypothetical protein DL546_007359 [Coniochaeta pulveracea]